MKYRLLARAAAALGLALLAACGHSSATGPATVGVGIGVALSSPSGTTIVQQGATIQIDATVNGDATNSGVTWTLADNNGGKLASSSSTSAVYQAPGGITGAVYATLTATAVADTTKSSSVTLTVNGTPVILQPVLFPANQNVAYATYISVVGGTAPYTWTISVGALPAGLSLGSSTVATVPITGTPTALGTSTFTIQVTDSAGLTASLPMSLTVAPQTACLLYGPYAYLQSGFAGGAPAARAGSFSVTTTGAVTGIYDYKDVTRARPGSALTGTCQTITQNRGQLHFSSQAIGGENFDYGTVASLARGHLQQDDGSGIVEAGEFLQQDPTAFSLAALAGDWVFGAVGDDGAGNRLTVAGRVTLDASGNISLGAGDSNGAAPVVNGAVTGTLTAPDSNGRGALPLGFGTLSLPFAYYVVDANTLFIVSSDSATTTPRLAGRMTRQSGAGALDTTALSGPAVLSMWGSSLVNKIEAGTLTAGRLSGSTAATGVALAAVDVALDIADRGTQSVYQVFTGSPYAVASNGRGTLTIGTGGAQRSFTLYADGAGSAYLIEPGSAVGNFGILQAQVAGPYSDFTTAYYVGGTMFAASTSPITLAPQLLFQSGAIGGNLTGNYALDPTTGRMVAAVSRTILGGSDLIIYIVSPDRLVIMGDNLNITNSQLAWFDHY